MSDEIAELRERLARVEAAYQRDVGRSPDDNRVDEVEDLDDAIREASDNGRSTFDAKGPTR